MSIHQGLVPTMSYDFICYDNKEGKKTKKTNSSTMMKDNNYKSESSQHSNVDKYDECNEKALTIIQSAVKISF